jgi:hypothetical protein
MKMHILIIGLVAMGIGLVHADTAVLVKTIVGPDTLTIFGASIAPVRNFRGTGEVDLLIGAYDRSGSIGSPGWAYMYYGGSLLDSLWDVQYRGEQGRVGDWTGYGQAVSSAGDFNGDGYEDIIIGSPHYDDPASSTGDDGRIYLYKGGPTPDTIPLWHLDTPHTYGATFGYSVACIGDLNKDGCGDIIAGAPNDIGPYGQGFTGGAYIFLGDSTNPNSIIDYELYGRSNQEGFGWRVNGLGDINGDSYPEITVGSPGGYGKVYIYSGNSPFDTTCDYLLQGRYDNGRFGQSISHGDFNNDGYEDVIVGEYGYNNNTGRAYIYLGGASPDTVPDLILNGTKTGECFGYQVCGARDLNGDSIDDWIISAPWHTNATDSFAGRIIIYYGKTLLDTAIALSFTGNYYKSRIGTNVSSLADINNDSKNEFTVKWGSSASGLPSNIKIYQIDVNGVAGQGTDENKIKDIYIKCYPNPFSERTRFTYKLPNDGYIKLSIYNITGQLVKTIEKGFKKVGNYEIEWSGTGDNGLKLNSGIYFYRIDSGGFSITKKMVLLK